MLILSNRRRPPLNVEETAEERVRSRHAVVRGVGQIAKAAQVTSLKQPLVHAGVCAEVSNLLVTIPSGLCPDWAEWDPNQPVENAREAMQQADDWLGVPQVRCAIGARRDASL